MKRLCVRLMSLSVLALLAAACDSKPQQPASGAPAAPVAAPVEQKNNPPKFKDADLSENVCSGGLPISGGDHKDGYVAAMAFDKNEATIWGSGQTGPNVSGNAYIGYDFGQGKTYAVRRIVFKQGGRLDAFTVQSKTTEKGKWTDVPAINKYKKDSYDVVELEESKPARYWRILAASNAGDEPAAWTVYELQMNVMK